MRTLQFVLYTAGFQLAVWAGYSLVSRSISVPSWAALHLLALLVFGAAFAVASRMLAFSARTRWPSASYRADILPKILYVNGCYAPILAGHEFITHGTSGYAAEAGLAAGASIVLALTLGRYTALRKQRKRDTLAKAIAAGEEEMEFVLFLRPFSLEGSVQISERAGKLRHALASALDPVSFAPAKNQALDTAIASALDGVPTLSLGWPTPVVGAGTIETSEKTWKPLFENLADRASAIVFFPHSSEGTMDELEYLSGAGLLHKTTFVCPPSDGQLGASWRGTIESASRIGLAFPAYDSSGFMFRYSPPPGEEYRIAPSRDWSPGGIRATILDVVDAAPRPSGLGKAPTLPAIAVPVLDPSWDPLFEHEVPAFFEKIFGAPPSREEKHPMKLVRLSLAARLVLQSVMTRALLWALAANPILLHLLGAPPLVTVGGTTIAAIGVLFLCVVMNHALAKRRFVEWDDREAIASSRARLAPVVNAGIRAALASSLTMVALHSSSLGLLYLSYAAWSWWGVVSLLAVFFALRPLPLIFTSQALSVLHSLRTEDG